MSPCEGLEDYCWEVGVERAKKLDLDNSQLRNIFKKAGRGFPGGAVVENLPANAGDTGSSPGLGRSHMPRSD